VIDVEPVPVVEKVSEDVKVSEEPVPSAPKVSQEVLTVPKISEEDTKPLEPVAPEGSDKVAAEGVNQAE
jgi:hypothetical protein